MTDDFCKLLDEAIADEGEAKKLYTNLKKKTDCPVVKSLITIIRDEEAGHAKVLKEVRKQECGGRR